MKKRYIYREEVVNKHLLILVWLILGAVAISYYAASKIKELLELLIVSGIFIIPTILYAFMKRMPAWKYIFTGCAVAFTFLMLHIQKGLFDNTYIFFLIMAGTAVYIHVVLTLVITLTLVAGTLALYLVDAGYYFPGFELSNMVILLVVLTAVGGLIAVQTYLGKKVMNSQLELYRSATRDPLSNAYNRYFFDEVLEYSFANCQAQKRNMTVLICDVDGLKEVNDTFGHPAGDIVIRKTSESLMAACRKSDIVARLGGDEFGVILFDVDSDEAQIVVDKCKEAIRRAFMYEPFKASASFGLADLSTADTPADLFKYANEAMYLEKKTSKLNKMAAVNLYYKPDVK